jgi:predicted transcriptional regulator
MTYLHGLDTSMVKEYRSTNMIIQSILETLIHTDPDHPYLKSGKIKSHVVKSCGLKVITAEKYLEKMEKAGYIITRNESWGERTITILDITPKGRERYTWFVKINTELE